MKILITGVSGFIGFHLATSLLKNKKNKIYGIDNMNKYYDIKLKQDRLNLLKKNKNFFFKKIDIANSVNLKKYSDENKFSVIVHLAAQAGVRYSINYPEEYVKSNLVGFFNILELSKIKKIKHLLFASTSSVYGGLKKYPFNEKDNTDRPLSFYAATKKSNEMMAYSYSNIHKLPITSMRFFTVYGPMGRPDMALYKFANGIIKNKKINLFNKGDHYRDFTYIEDVVRSIKKLILKPPKKNIPFEIYNIGSNQPKSLKYFISLIEGILQKKSKKNFLKIQKGDVHKTHADIRKLKNKTGIKINTSLEEGIIKYIKWLRKYNH